MRTDYSVLGDAINVAQRLEVAAPSGETYVGELTEQLTRRSFELESVGQLMLKGKAHPVAAWRVVRQRAATIETARWSDATTTGESSAARSSNCAPEPAAS